MEAVKAGLGCEPTAQGIADGDGGEQGEGAAVGGESHDRAQPMKAITGESSRGSRCRAGACSTG